MKKNIIFIIFALLILPIAFSEILVQTNEGGINGHQFVVNKYYFQQMQQLPEEDTSAILIQLNETEKTISQCSQTEYFFNLANPTKKTQTYSIKISNFKGTAYLSPNIIIPSKGIRKIHVILMPECEFSGNLNPKITIETEEETAEIPLLLNVIPVEIEEITKNDCLYHYNESVCESENYIKFYQGTKYKRDLNELFYDPDGDNLEFSADAFNLDVRIRKGEATIVPLYNFIGSEEVIFYAEDNKGGKAQSQTFYFHVLNNGRSYLENFVLLNLPLIIGLLLLIFVILLIMAFVVRPAEKTQHKNTEEKKEKIPEPPDKPRKTKSKKKQTKKSSEKLKKK